MPIPELTTARLRMRPFRRGDATRLHALFVEDAVRRHLWDGEVIPWETSAAVVQGSLENDAVRGIGMWTLRLRADEAFAGFCGFRPLAGTEDLEILYAVGEGFAGRGFATEAARAAVDWLFATHAAIPRVVAGADPPNAPSFHVMRKLGMSQVARPSAAEGKQVVWYELTRTAWPWAWVPETDYF